MSQGDKNQYDSIKGTEEAEFYTLMDLHKKKIQKQIEQNKSKSYK